MFPSAHQGDKNQQFILEQRSDTVLPLGEILSLRWSQLHILLYSRLTSEKPIRICYSVYFAPGDIKHWAKKSQLLKNNIYSQSAKYLLTLNEISLNAFSFPWFFAGDLSEGRQFTVVAEMSPSKALCSLLKRTKS